MESTETPPLDSEEVKILRGLFYVHLYGALEQSLNEAVACFLQEIASMNFCAKDFSLGFWPVAMNSHFQGLSAVQSNKKWSKRVEFVSAVLSENPCEIGNAIFSPHFQSSESTTISDVARYLGMNHLPIASSADRYYVDEVVQKRHQVAHGRVNPSLVGARGRSSELEIRFDAVSRIVEMFMSLLEEYYSSLAFLTDEARLRIQGD